MLFAPYSRDWEILPTLSLLSLIPLLSFTVCLGFSRAGRFSTGKARPVGRAFVWLFQAGLRNVGPVEKGGNGATVAHFIGAELGLGSIGAIGDAVGDRKSVV